MKNGGVLNIAMNWNRSTVTKRKASVLCSECFFFLLINLFRAIIWQIFGVALEDTLTCCVFSCVPQFDRKHITDSKRTCFVLQSAKRWSTKR